MKLKNGAKDPCKPKRPQSPFFLFMNEFRTKFIMENPGSSKLITVIGKAAGKEWSSMSCADKAPYVVKAMEEKKEYDKLYARYVEEKEAANAVEIMATKEVESHFIVLLEEEVKKGNRQKTTLTKPTWKRIKEELKRKIGKDYTIEQLENKFNGLRAKWKEFTDVIKMETGIGYNSTTGQIRASDEEWKKLYKKYKSAKQFRKEGCSHYDKLCIIFGDTTVSGANPHPSTKSPIIIDDSEEENVGSDRKKRKMEENMTSVKNMGQSSKTKDDILEKRNVGHAVGTSSNAMGKFDGQDNETNQKLMTCLSILDKLEGIDGVRFTKALRMLKEDLLWRDVFMALSDDRKKDFVLNL